jgi:hypothetical protein
MAGGHWVTIKGHHILLDDAEARALRAIESHRPQSKAKMKLALAQEMIVAEAINGRNLPDNEPFDVIAGEYAVEVKTIVRGKNPKVTMHAESLARKLAYAKKNKLLAVTVAIDARGDVPHYYYKDGVGSFRLAGMARVSLRDLGKLLKP